MLELITSFALGGLGFLFVISLVVFVHELGHFLAGRYFGVKVETFSIGFGKELIGFTDRYGTRWKFAALPLGGYVKFWGDEGAASTPDQDKLKQMPETDRSRSFHHKTWWQKSIISVAGPLANFILALVILTGFFLVYGSNSSSPIIGNVKAGYPAELAGLKPGDRVVSIDDQEISDFSAIVKVVSVANGRPLKFVVERAGARELVVVTPAMISKPDSFGAPIKDPGVGISPVIPGEIETVVSGSPAAAAGLKVNDIIVGANGKGIATFADIAGAVTASGGQPVKLIVARSKPTPTKPWNREQVEVTLTPSPALASAASSADQQVLQVAGFSVYAKGSPEPYVHVTFGVLESVSAASDEVKFIVVKTFYFIGQLLTGSADYQQLSGPIGIATVSGKVAVQFGVVALINLAAVLSVSIGLLNLFPIPMLDGGHILYYAIEAVRGRPLGERAQELGFRFGLAFVVCLLLFATWNDLTKLVSSG
jgi:regulator of sigma E protease